MRLPYILGKQLTFLYETVLIQFNQITFQFCLVSRAIQFHLDCKQTSHHSQCSQRRGVRELFYHCLNYCLEFHFALGTNWSWRTTLKYACAWWISAIVTFKRLESICCIAKPWNCGLRKFTSLCWVPRTSIKNSSYDKTI